VIRKEERAMGIFKRNPAKIKAEAEKFIDAGEQIQAFTCGTMGGSSGPGMNVNFVVAATERHVYVLRQALMSLGVKLGEVQEKLPLGDVRVEMMSDGVKINDDYLRYQNFWKQETQELVDYVAAGKQPAT
jgi:hypothetical protein